MSDALFPLTPALSLRERENRILSLEKPTRYSLSKARPIVLPLPKGEGWGEGEQGRRAHRAPKLEMRVRCRPYRRTPTALSSKSIQRRLHGCGYGRFFHSSHFRSNECYFASSTPQHPSSPPARAHASA